VALLVTGTVLDLQLAGPWRVAGRDLVFAGLGFLIFTFVLFVALAAEYFRRTWKSWHSVPFAATKLLDSLKFKLFVAGITVASLAITIRCIYRIIELDRRWSDQAVPRKDLFVGLESRYVPTYLRPRWRSDRAG
jgi:hypothetical protein